MCLCVCLCVCVQESLLPLGAHVMSIFVAYFQRVRAAVCECACLYMCVCACVCVLPVCVSFEAKFMQVMLGPRVWLSSCARVKLFASPNIYWHRCPAALRPMCVCLGVCLPHRRRGCWQSETRKSLGNCLRVCARQGASELVL